MTEREAITILRRHVPAMRRRYSTAIVHSGGTQTVYGCVCGSEHTVATRNRGRTRHESNWQSAHHGCAAALAAQLLAGYEVTVSIGRHTFVTVRSVEKCHV